MLPPSRAVVAVEWLYPSWSDYYSCSCSEQTQSAKAAVKMRLPKGGRNFNIWKAKPVRLARTCSFDHPQSELRQLFFDIRKANLGKIKTHCGFIFGGILFRHQWLPPRHSFPINVALG